jgi:hypothetical protein
MRVMEKAGMICAGRESEGDIELVTYVIERSVLRCAS